MTDDRLMIFIDGTMKSRTHGFVTQADCVKFVEALSEEGKLKMFHCSKSIQPDPNRDTAISIEVNKGVASIMNKKITDLRYLGSLA